MIDPKDEEEKMSKKVKLVVITVCCLAVIGFCVDLAHYVFSRYVQETNDTIAKLEQEVVSANEKADQAVTKAEDTKKKLKEADAQIADLQKENKELEKVAKEAVTGATEIATPTPKTTIVATEAPKSSDTPDITGLWVDTMSNRTKMNISYRENRPGFDIVIDASDGAVTGTEFLVGTDGYDASIGGFPYHGAAYRYEYNNVTYRDDTLISSDMSGVLKYSNDHLYWIDDTNLITYQNLEFQRQ